VGGRASAVVTTARVGLTRPTPLDGAVLAFDVDVRAAPAAPWHALGGAGGPDAGVPSWLRP